MQVDQPVAKPSTTQSKETAKKGTDGVAGKPSADSTKAAPSKVPKPKPKDSGKGARVKASASTRPPPTAIEPATVEHGAVEEQVPEGPPGAIAAEAWETVTRRVKGRRQQPDARPPPEVAGRLPAWEGGPLAGIGRMSTVSRTMRSGSRMIHIRLIGTLH